MLIASTRLGTAPEYHPLHIGPPTWHLHVTASGHVRSGDMSEPSRATGSFSLSPRPLPLPEDSDIGITSQHTNDKAKPSLVTETHFHNKTRAVLGRASADTRAQSYQVALIRKYAIWYQMNIYATEHIFDDVRIR